jgi:hypothetical protein
MPASETCIKLIMSIIYIRLTQRTMYALLIRFLNFCIQFLVNVT